MSARRLALAAAALLVAAPIAARAETRRIAVVVGSNRGDAGHAPLRYAEQDAINLATVLTELGGLSASDVKLLRGPTLATVREALDDAAGRVARWRTDHQRQAVLLFFFSGHSDGQVLELGGETLAFGELRRRLTDSGADMRIVIVDSCRSGALLALKGGTLGPAFDIRLADDLGSTGEALIASSAADEAALESAEIGASFFSHHFISGLRGAADLSGDGLVTLAEAYQYAFARTVRATSDTLMGPQHPAYDYHLAGRGDLVLTELRHPSAVLDLPATFDRLLLVATPKEQVVAEIGPRSAHRIAVPAGGYSLRAWRGSRAYGASIRVAQGQELRLSDSAFQATAGSAAFQKGGAEPAAVVAASRAPAPVPGDRDRWAVSGAVGLSAGIADGALLGTVRAGIEEKTSGARRVGVVVLAGSGRVTGMRENRVGAELRASWWAGGGGLEFGAGIALGGGAAIERTDAGDVHWSGLGWAAPGVMIEARLIGGLALIVGGDVPVTLVRRDDWLLVTGLPAAWLGLSRAF